MTTESARPTSEVLECTVRLPQHVVYRVFPAETVVLDLDSGKYHGLNPVGGRMIEALEQTEVVREAVDRLTAEFPGVDPAEIERDLVEFCTDLAERGLLELNGRHPS